MKPGSIVVDLAAESGGNVEGSVAGETTMNGQVVGLGRLERSVTDARRRVTAVLGQRSRTCSR